MIFSLLATSYLFFCLLETDGTHGFADKLGFDKISEEQIPECKSLAVLYKHRKTGAEIMSVSTDDENKVFGIVFRTPP